MCIRDRAQLRSGWDQNVEVQSYAPEATLRALWLAASGVTCSVEAAEDSQLPHLSPDSISRLKHLVAQLLSGVHLAHLTQRWRFMGLDFIVGPEALVPRKETEYLCTRALHVLSEIVAHRDGATVIEPCTGSGNLAISLAYYEPTCEVFASDLSENALQLATRNASSLHLMNRIRFYAGDLLSPFERLFARRKADLLVCNPPYISAAKLDTNSRHVLKYGPRMAFDGGPFGLSIVNRLIEDGPRLLKPNSYLCFELGIGQGDCIARMMRRMPSFVEVRVETDPATGTPIIISRTS